MNSIIFYSVNILILVENCNYQSIALMWIYLNSEILWL